MPLCAPSVCACSRIVASGQRCACKIVSDRQRAKAHDARRGSARSRGYDSKWDRERKAFLLINPVCKLCPAISTIVDHVIPHRGDMKLFWDRSNWQPLCTHHHSSTKQALEKSAPR